MTRDKTPSTPEQTARDLAADAKIVFSSPHGQRLLAWLKDRCAHGKNPFAVNQEPWQAPYRAGAQQVVTDILNLIDTPPNTQITATIKK